MYGVKIKNTLQIDEMFTMSWQKFSGGYFFKGESHDFYEVVCVLSGRVGITAGKNVFVLSENQMTIHYPGEFHAIWEDGETCPECIIFSFSALHFPTIKGHVYKLTDDLLADIKNLYAAACKIFAFEGGKSFHEGSVIGGEGVSVYKNGSAIVKTVDGGESDASIFVKRLEIFLAVAMSRLTEESSEYLRGSEHYAKIMAVLDDNIDNNLSLKELSQLCGLSVPSLEKIVFKYLHVGVMTYYNALKMERAAALLSSGASVKETAVNLGFSNQNYFSACFKKRFGYSPSKIKRNY